MSDDNPTNAEDYDPIEVEENTLGVPPRPDQTPEDDQLAIKVEEAMFDVVDPEIGINVVDLGLVYDLWIENGSTAVIHMTLTSPACPLTDLLTSQTETLVMDVDGIEDFRINWVWSPPWGPQFITEDGRDQMRALGFSV
ncbi:metal-sulfur cluster assembly factor [Corynebacterium sp. TAE3-ERU12]|uniref:metal-sulfur cluster assembly factor n=1 Tax=Corynebacterium sp. TAE3-ERU12 TaxID=2849491 RepID=UPI001C458AB2|nr:metal-sulfur cluster assembly factor [Corynebacterium sp. TAE3-ERU12]MBV7295432.1 metal-sulfur cluster assembly factor [Corynebacterium sp. TAE3-ERU12]